MESKNNERSFTFITRFRQNRKTMNEVQVVIDSLEGEVRFAGPVCIDSDTSDGGCRGGAGAFEEGAREPRDVVLLHGDIELALVQLIATGIEGRYCEMDSTFGIMQEGVEVAAVGLVNTKGLSSFVV